MANLLIPRREIWTQQPQVPVEIDWSNPISAGLLRSYDFGNLGRDATRNGAAWWSTGSTQPAITTAGRGLKVAASGQLSSNESVSGQISTGITLFLIAEKNAKILSASDFIFGATTELDAGDFNWGFYESVSTGNLSGFVKNASNVSVNVTGGTNWLPDKGPQFWALTYGGGDNFVRLYLNGFEVGSAAQTGLIKQTALNARIAGWNVSSPTPGFTVIRADIWNRNIGSDGVARLSKYPWQIFAPQSRQLFVPVGGGSTTSLTVQGASHAHFADSPSFSMATHLAVAESLHAHAADNVTLATTGTANLVVQEATHAHIADGVTLTTQWMLTVAEALHGHAADNITLGATGTANLAIADATSGHTSDTVALTLNSLLAVFDAIHAHSADNLTLDTSNATALTVQDSTHAHGADSLGLSLDTWLAIVEAAHSHTADAPTLSTALALQIAESLHAHYADVVVLGFPSAPGSGPTVEEIVAAVLAALNATTIPVNIKQVNSITIKGAGVTGNTWGPQ